VISAENLLSKEVSQWVKDGRDVITAKIAEMLKGIHIKDFIMRTSKEITKEIFNTLLIDPEKNDVIKIKKELQ
jgi:hypothetical protein